MKDNKIINENNYSNYIKYLESNLIGLSVMFRQWYLSNKRNEKIKCNGRGKRND